MFLEIPENRHPLGYLVEMVPNWKTFSSITISKSAYETILSYRDAEIKREFNRIYCGPKISFQLKQITCDLWEISWIEYKGLLYSFNNDPVGNSAYITCKSAA